MTTNGADVRYALTTGARANDTIYLAAAATEYTDALVSFACIMAGALLAPLVAYVFRNRIPAVALLLESAEHLFPVRDQPIRLFSVSSSSYWQR